MPLLLHGWTQLNHINEVHGLEQHMMNSHLPECKLTIAIEIWSRRSLFVDQLWSGESWKSHLSQKLPFAISHVTNTCNSIVVDGCVVLGGVLIDVHLGRVSQLSELVLWDVREALGLKGLQIGHVLTCKFKSMTLPKTTTTTTTLISSTLYELLPF